MSGGGQQRILVGQAIGERRRVYFTCRNTTDVNDRLQSSDMGGTFTCKLSKKGQASVTPCAGAPVPVQIDATNQKGAFYLELVAADCDTPGPSVLTISNSGGSKSMRPRDILLFFSTTESDWDTVPANITQVGGTVIPTPNTAGVLRVDVHGMETGVLTAAAFAANAIGAAAIADGAFDLATFAADARLSLFGVLDAGTAQAGSSATLTLRSGALANDGAYAGAMVFIISGAGALEVNQIDSYVGATKVATMKANWPGAVPNATSSYVIVASGAAGTAPTAAANAAATWAAIAEGSYQYGDFMRLFAAILAGLSSDYTTGSLVWKALTSAKTRWSHTTDPTGRRVSTPGDLTP